MTIFTVTGKRELTLTSDVLERLGFHPGDRIAAVERADGKLELSAVKAEETIATRDNQKDGLEKFFGSLKNEHDLHFTIDELNEEIEKAWAGQR